MLATVDEFKELLNNDIIEPEKLKDSARHGIPDEVRGEVWKFLIGGLRLDISARSPQPKRFELSVKKQIRGELRRYKRKALLDEHLLNTLENVLEEYMERNTSVVFSPALIYICGPLVYALRDEADTYWTFEGLMKLLDELDQNYVLKFMSLIRIELPELYSHFENEEVEWTWAYRWVKYLLAQDLPLLCLLRLWDAYFVQDSARFLDLHIRVCLCILRQFSEELEDMEGSDIQAFLQHLPMMNMDEILEEAHNNLTQ